MPHEESVQDAKPQRALYPRLVAVDGVLLPTVPVEDPAPMSVGETGGDKTSPMSGFIMGEFSRAETAMYLMETDLQGESQKKSGAVRSGRMSRLRRFWRLTRLWSSW